MAPYPPDNDDDIWIGPAGPYDGTIAEADLWFLPGPADEAADIRAPLPPLPRTPPREAAQIGAWERAQRDHAARLARVAARLGALDDRLARGPAGWRHRLAVIEASGLSWLAGHRVPPDRLGLWLAMRISSVREDSAALQRTAWAFRRLAGGPGPEADLAGFLDRHEVSKDDPLSDRISAWTALMAAAGALHPIARACLACHLWPLSGIGPEGDRLDGAVIARRLAAAEAQGGALFAPVPPGGADAGGPPPERLRHWLQAMEQGLIHAMRHLDRLEAWETAATARAARLSGRTPPRLIALLRDWPLITAAMAGEMTGSSRAAIQRNLAWLETRGLIAEITGQGRFRVWRAAL